MNHFLLNLLAENAAAFVPGRRIGEIRLLAPVVAIEFAGGEKPHYGVVILSSPGPFFYFDTAHPLQGLGTEVLKRVRGLSVSGIEVPAHDRSIRFGLSAAREELTLAVTLFGSAAKVRVESADTIVESLLPRENGRPIAAGPPSPGGADALATVEEATLAGDPRPPRERRVLGLSPELIDAFTAPAGFDAAGLVRFRDDLLGAGKPFHLATRRGAGSVCPVPSPLPANMETPARLYGPFTRALEACKVLGDEMLRSLRGVMVDRWAAPLEKRIAARRRLLSALEEEHREAGTSAALRREAEALAAYRSRISPGASQVNLPDLYGSGEVTIHLDPAVPIHDQIDKRFRAAAKLERKRAALGGRIDSLKEELAGLDREILAAKSDDDLHAAIDRIDRLGRRQGLDSTPGRVPRVRQKARELRRFDLDPQWFALVGRSERENDEITFRIADPEDLWFHAQHVAGSHVVLRSRGGNRSNPPRLVLEAAAAIAAHYSKARRASLVPVIYTRRKYVRKFKGAKPGQVLCEREKTIFAKPALPPSAQSSGEPA